MPYFIRRKLQDLKNNRLNLPDRDYPPRKDGGYGWFHVAETADEDEQVGWYGMGCSIAGNDSGSRSEKEGRIYYYMDKYYHDGLFHDGGTRWLCAHDVPQNCRMGALPQGLLAEEDTVRLLGRNLIVKDGDGYKLNFACFTQRQFADFCVLSEDDGRLDDLLCNWILSVRRSFEGFVSKRLHSQINQWIFCYCGELGGPVMEELIRRGRLDAPKESKPLVDGIFYVEGKYISEI